MSPSPLWCRHLESWNEWLEGGSDGEGISLRNEGTHGTSLWFFSSLSLPYFSAHSPFSQCRPGSSFLTVLFMWVFKMFYSSMHLDLPWICNIASLPWPQQISSQNSFFLSPPFKSPHSLGYTRDPMMPHKFTNSSQCNISPLWALWQFYLCLPMMLHTS